MLLLIGLDCAPPALVFDRYRDAMPNLRALCARGLWGPLRSIVPPITVPAWASMLSGRDAGELGVYGFRNREFGQRELSTTFAEQVRVPRVWDVAGEHGKRSVVLFVPPSWPPTPIANGEMVSCLLTPSSDAPRTSPPELATELEQKFGPQRVDVVHMGDGEEFIDELFAAAEQHFDVAEHLLTTRKPDLLAMVEIGTDRLHHAFWTAIDPSDPRHVPGSSASRLARDFYAYIDSRVGRLCERAGASADVMVVSDHGARSLEGGVFVNEWLRREGFLKISGPVPNTPTKLHRASVDWPNTAAWAEGGYYSRIMINDRARFADGCVEPEQVEGTLERILEGLSGLVAGTRILRPRAVYRELRGEPPDAMVFFGDLSHRALAELGSEDVLAPPQTAGASRANDGCNHDWKGIVIAAGPSFPKCGRVEDAQLHDIGRTALSVLGIDAPIGWLGRDLRHRL